MTDDPRAHAADAAHRTRLGDTGAFLAFQEAADADAPRGRIVRGAALLLALAVVVAAVATLWQA